MSDMDYTEQARPAYHAEVDRGGCDRCGAGKLWAVVGPDDIALGTMFEHEDDAAELAEWLTHAFEAGAAADRERLDQAEARIRELETDLVANAKVCAQQCDLARAAEIRAFQLEHEKREQADQACARIQAALDAARWRICADESPPENVPVLAYFRDQCGKGSRRVRATYYGYLQLPLSDEATMCDPDYNEEDGRAYCPAGWYETNDQDETYWWIGEQVTHWMPLPPEPPITPE